MTILINNTPLAEASVFPGGETHIKLPNFIFVDNITVTAKIRSANDLMELILVKEALDYYYNNLDKYLVLHYMPYARQDRRCNPGESFSLMPVLNMINRLDFHKVICADLHSSTSRNLKNLEELSVVDIFMCYGPDYTNEVIIAPDKGSEQRARSIANLYSTEYIVCNKTRVGKDIVYEDLSVSDRRLLDRDVLIVDDICDGGATFIALASNIRKNASVKKISLYVTHGIFSKGIGILFDAGIDRIITTDSITTLQPTEGLEIWKI